RKMSRRMPRPYGGLLGPVLTPLARVYWFFDRWLLELLVIQPVNWAMHWLTRGYAWFLRLALRFQTAVILAGLLLAASTALFIFGLDLPLPEWLAEQVGTDTLTIKPIGRELVPSEDQNRFIVNV